MVDHPNHKRLLAAVDSSDAGRNAARFAAGLAERLGSELTILTVLPSRQEPGTNRGLAPDFRDVLGADVLAGYPALAVELASVRGIPQVEIPRYAERVKAGLIILGRKPRSRTVRLMMGDTADAVVRRSRMVCLQVPVGQVSARRMVVALDGTNRGQWVLRTAARLAGATGIRASAVTVEPQMPGEIPHVSSRSEQLTSLVEETLHFHEPGSFAGVAVSPLVIRHGDPVEQVLAEVGNTRADLLVTGFRPGGPLLMANETSVSRQLVQMAPCAVMTVPL
jgi:nucleotide-binding universal stress UspA family protein